MQTEWIPIEPLAEDFVDFRGQAHWAAQIPASLGTRLLPFRDDYTHTAFDWLPHRRALAGQRLLRAPRLRAGLRIEDLTVLLLDEDDTILAKRSLDGLTLEEGFAWLQHELSHRLGSGMGGRVLGRSELTVPHHPVADGARFALGDGRAARQLSTWFHDAHRALERVRSREGRAGPVRTWPHHFDMATLVTYDPEADPEHARSVNLGLSPGDDTFAEPYFYVSPWPYPSPDRLSELPLGRWHTDGFVAAILHAADLVGDEAPERALDAFVDGARSAAAAAIDAPVDARERARRKLVWFKALEPDELPEGRVKAVTLGRTTVCMTHYQGTLSALDNRCPHQGGPLGEGSIENGKLRCPWHGWDFDPCTGRSPPPFEDGGVARFPVESRPDGVYVGLEEEAPHVPTVTDVMARTFTAWGVRHVFGMVGHSNLGLADALRREEEAGRLRYYGIRHEGAASFAVSAYGKLTGRPAACLSIAGPGATNLLTGLWDANVDRAPALALTGQVETQVMGPGAFQEVDLMAAYGKVAQWSQPVLTTSRHAELANLAVKSAILNRGVSHLIFPDEVQTVPAREGSEPGSPQGRIAALDVAPPAAALDAAVAALEEAERPVIIVGHGARFHMDAVRELAEAHGIPVMTTFKGKGLISDRHPLGCGVLGRSGTPIASWFMNEADVLVVLGASFSNHTGISSYKRTIQVDRDPMALGRFHPITVPVLGDIEVTVRALSERLKAQAVAFRDQRDDVAARWELWRAEKSSRRADDASKGLGSALLFETLGNVAPEDAILCVDVGNNTYSFGRYFETRRHAVLMSGYLGSIGFSLPAAMGAWAATRERESQFWGRKVISVSGDGGFGQYMGEMTTAVKYGMSITHVLLNNGNLGKITKEQRSAQLSVWQTSLQNPDFARYTELCGGMGLRVEAPDELQPALEKALAHEGPSLVEVITDPELV